MRTLFIVYFFAFGFLVGGATVSAQKKDKPSGQLTKLVKTATGIYDSQPSLLALQIDTMANPHLRRQLIVCYPIWETESGADRWMYFGWFSPHDKDNALEEIFLRFYEKDGKPIAEWYQMSENIRSNHSQEWAKEVPFGDMLPSDVQDPSAGLLFSTCDIKNDKGGFLMKARALGEFKEVTPAAYKYMLIDMGFYPNKYTSGSQFLAADGKTVIIGHEHRFELVKTSKKYKKF